MAVREGFEPSIQLLTVYSLSRGAPSAARPPHLRAVDKAHRHCVAHILLSRPDKSNNFSRLTLVCTKAIQLDDIASKNARTHGFYRRQYQQRESSQLWHKVEQGKLISRMMRRLAYCKALEIVRKEPVVTSRPEYAGRFLHGGRIPL